MTPGAAPPPQEVPAPAAAPMQALPAAGVRTELRQGTRIFLDDAAAGRAGLAARLQVSPGTQRLQVEGQRGTKYENGIFVPRDDWRALSPAELALIEGSGPCDAGRDIRVFVLPEWLQQFFWDLDLGGLVAGEGFSATSDDPLFNAFCGEAQAALGALGVAARRLTVRFQRARSRSTTFDPEFGTFVGLHVDNFERRPIDTRHRSFPRLVVNLGLQPRSFVFINQPLIELFEPSGIARSPEAYRKYSWAYPLAHAFMAAVPDYPVVRLALDPGEGYAAPTQDLIHDGYTRDGEGIDVVLSGFVGEA